MKYQKPPLKRLTDKVSIPVLGIGTWGIGGRYKADKSKDKKCIEAIRKAIELGYTLIDTAELYGNGHAEELIAEAIKNFDREKLFIISKVSPENHRYNDLINSCKNSLRRLQINCLDLYLLHQPNHNIPFEETMRAMDYLVENKMTRFIGVSNFSVNDIKQAQKYAKNKIVANQIQYSLAARNKGLFNINMESKIIPYCIKNNILVISWRPLAKGKLSKHGFNKTLDDIAKKYHKTPAQIAINWVISKKGVVTLVKSTNIEHIKENLGALTFKLDKKDINKLDREFNV